MKKKQSTTKGMREKCASKLFPIRLFQFLIFEDMTLCVVLARYKWTLK